MLLRLKYGKYKDIMGSYTHTSHAYNHNSIHFKILKGSVVMFLTRNNARSNATQRWWKSKQSHNMHLINIET